MFEPLFSISGEIMGVRRVLVKCDLVVESGIQGWSLKGIFQTLASACTLSGPGGGWEDQNAHRSRDNEDYNISGGNKNSYKLD